MTLVLADLELELEEHLGLDATDVGQAPWTVDRIDLLLNRSFWEIQYKFPFREKELTATFVTVAGTRLYAIPVLFEALRQLSIEDVNDFSHSVLQRTTIYDYEQRFVNDPSGVEQDKPTHYTREGLGIRLLPTPDRVYTVTIKYQTTLADLSTQNNVPVIPQIWHEVILYGAVWRGFMRLGDYARAQAAKAHQRELMAEIQPVEAKEETDTHLGGLDVAWDDPANSPLRVKLDAFGDPLRLPP
jgi:hypothetical protein